MAALTDQVVVVTGASSGIGKAIALSLAAQGVTLCLVARNLEALETVAEIARATASQVLLYQIDLTVDEDIQQLKTRLEQDLGAVDLLIHSAGVITLGQMKTASLEDFDWQYRVNVRAPYALTQALLPMLTVRQGQIAFINSTAGLNARGGVGQYAATKHALKAIADSLREEVNADGVRVLSIYPGRTASPMQAAIVETEGKTYHPERLLQPEDVANAVLNALSLPRTAEVTDINIRPLRKA
ncbi:SDR family oxidoreductase [Coleofasciculus sp. FACHB-1120]|uniref:SDR family oxidoreductase n=1 Tax=Coleofasciculus sp. FACHB-1120 TaxID=2692783 RepID=UPI001682B479|nr:SDR family oxidoreductase [Coleofasciculus sp. FACHB-1120]MBD2744101.1 SDR family oxidoreductase [Coleofasciculus sp. FACHB-1120]